MEIEREIGYSDTAPQGSSERPNPPREQRPYPPVDRPVYSVPKDAKKKENNDLFGGDFNFTVLFVVAILVLALGGIYLYGNPDLFSSSTKVAEDPIAKEKALISRENLKLELKRTADMLEQVEKKNDSLGEGDLEKVRELRQETLDLLNAVGG